MAGMMMMQKMRVGKDKKCCLGSISRAGLDLVSVATSPWSHCEVTLAALTLLAAQLVVEVSGAEAAYAPARPLDARKRWPYVTAPVVTSCTRGLEARVCREIVNGTTRPP